MDTLKDIICSLTGKIEINICITNALKYYMLSWRNIYFLCMGFEEVRLFSESDPEVSKSALNPPLIYSTERSKAVVPVLVLFFLALWFILRGDLLYVFPCVILFLCFSVPLVLRLPRLGKRELILVLFLRSIYACLDLSVSSSSWGLGRAAFCDCGISWTFLLPFFLNVFRIQLS